MSFTNKVEWQFYTRCGAEWKFYIRVGWHLVGKCRTSGMSHVLVEGIQISIMNTVLDSDAMRPAKWNNMPWSLRRYNMPSMTQRYSIWQDAYQNVTSIIMLSNPGLKLWWGTTKLLVLLLGFHSGSQMDKMRSKNRLDRVIEEKIFVWSDFTHFSTGCMTSMPSLLTLEAILVCSLVKVSLVCTSL